MAKNKNQFFDRIRTKAWIADVGMVCGSESAPLTPIELTKRDWGTNGNTKLDLRFDKWTSGSIVVSETSLNLVDQCLALEGKGPCKDVFLKGPEELPFWTLLSDTEAGFSESVCLDFITESLYQRERGKQVKWAAFSAKPFSVKVEDLWNLFIGRIPVDFDDYDSRVQRNALRIRIEREEVIPSLDLFALLLAVRQIAERRRECRDLARYMSDACFGMLDLFEPWGIKDDIEEILDSWYAPANPVTIARQDIFLIEKEGQMPAFTSPSYAGTVHRAFLKEMEKV